MDKGIQNLYGNAFHPGKSGVIHIRRFDPGDLKRVYEIEYKSFKDPYHPMFLLTLRELYEDTFLVALENEKVAGYAISRVVDFSGHVLAIAVDPESRGHDIGRALIKRSIECLKNLGAVKIWLEVRASNAGAIEFYKKLGFEQAGVVPSYYPDSEDAVILKKKI